MTIITVIDLNQHLLSVQAAYFRAKQADIHSDPHKNVPDQFNAKIIALNYARSNFTRALQAYIGQSGKGLTLVCFNKNKIEIPVTATVFDFDFTIVDGIMPAD